MARGGRHRKEDRASEGGKKSGLTVVRLPTSSLVGRRSERCSTGSRRHSCRSRSPTWSHCSSLNGRRKFRAKRLLIQLQLSPFKADTISTCPSRKA